MFLRKALVYFTHFKIKKTLAKKQGFSKMENRGLEPLTSTLPEEIHLEN